MRTKWKAIASPDGLRYIAQIDNYIYMEVRFSEPDDSYMYEVKICANDYHCLVASVVGTYYKSGLAAKRAATKFVALMVKLSGETIQ